METLEHSIYEVLFNLVINFWMRVVNLEVAVTKENSSRSISEISDFESALLVEIDNYCRDEKSIMFRQMFENSCMK